MVRKFIFSLLLVLSLSVSCLSLSASALSLSPSLSDIYTIFTSQDAFNYNRTNRVIIIYDKGSQNGKPTFTCYYLPNDFNSKISFTKVKNGSYDAFGSDLHPSSTYFSVHWNGSKWAWNSRGSSNFNYLPFFSDLDVSDYIYSPDIELDFGEYGKIKPSDPDAPFTVTFSPELFEGMTPNIISYPSKQGANGQNVTEELYKIDVTVSLTDDFLSVPISSSSLEYFYQFTTFIVPADFCIDDDISAITSHAIYTCSDHGKFFYNDATNSITTDQLAGSTGYYSGGNGWVCAEGLTNCYVISHSTPSLTISIPLENVPFVSSGYTDFKICTLGHIVRRDVYGYVPMPYYFKSSCPDLAFKSKASLPVSFNGSEVDETYEFYDYYTVLSDTFNYQSYPEYEGSGNISKPIDFENVPQRMQDYEMHQQTGGETSWRTPDDFAQYQAQKQWASNFTTDFGVGTISDILSGESNFFHFLTASISVLPSWFLTILSAFFVTLLALVVVKFVL